MGVVGPATLLGYPVKVTEKTPALGTKGDIILAALSAYYIGDRRDMTVAVSPHSRFATDEVEFRFTKRVDGKVALDEAFIALDVPLGY